MYLGLCVGVLVLPFGFMFVAGAVALNVGAAAVAVASHLDDAGVSL